MREIKITNMERKLFLFFDKYMYIFILSIVSMIGFYMRYKMLPYTNSDYTAYYEPWFYQIQANGGFKGLAGFNGGYNYAYDILLAFLTYLPLHPLVSIKMMSIFFDYVCATCAGLIAMEAYGSSQNRIRVFTVIYCCVVFSPVVMLNSAFWSQCESLYTAFVLLSIYLILKKRYGLAFLIYGVALAFKLQAIMIFPLFIYLYFLNQNFSFFNFLLIPIGTFLSSFPGMILTGNGIKGFFAKYFYQMNQGEYLTENFPNVYYWLSAKHYDMYKSLGMCFTIAALAVMFAYAYGKKNRQLDGNGIISLGMWVALCCVYFLPNMHERYGYMGELLCIIWAAGHKKHVWYPLLISTITLFSYFVFLFGYYLYWMQNMAVVLIACFIMYTIYMCHEIWDKKSS